MSKKKFNRTIALALSAITLFTSVATNVSATTDVSGGDVSFEVTVDTTDSADVIETDDEVISIVIEDGVQSIFETQFVA